MGVARVVHIFYVVGVVPVVNALSTVHIVSVIRVLHVFYVVPGVGVVPGGVGVLLPALGRDVPLSPSNPDPIPEENFQN